MAFFQNENPAETGWTIQDELDDIQAQFGGAGCLAHIGGGQILAAGPEEMIAEAIKWANSNNCNIVTNLTNQ